jgi:hypothetical protein
MIRHLLFHFSLLYFIAISPLQAQDYFFGLRINDVDLSNRSSSLNVDTSLIRPGSGQTTDRVDLEAVLHKKIAPSIYLITRIGFVSSEQTFQMVDLRGNNAGYVELYRKEESLSFRATFGLEKELLASKNVSLFIGSNIAFQQTGKERELLNVDYYKANLELDYTSSEQVLYPNTNALGLSINSSVFYFFNRVGIGLEFASRFNYWWQAGEVFQEPKIVDDMGNILSDIQISEQQTSAYFQRQLLFAVGLRYKIN